MGLGNGSWGLVGGGGSGGGTGDKIYRGPSPSTVDVENIPAGTNIYGDTYDYLLGNIYAPYVNPSFSAFAITQTTPVEVGTTLSGNKQFTWAFNNPGNLKPNSMSIIDVTAGNVAIASGLSDASPATVALPSPIQLILPGSYSWKGSVQNTQDATINSNNATVQWFWAIYNGTSANPTLNAAQIKVLITKQLKSVITGTYNFAALNYKYFCWVDSMGSPAANTGFKDASTGLQLSMADSSDDAFYSNIQNGWSYGLVSVTNDQGITANVRVYRTKFQLGATLQALVS